MKNHRENLNVPSEAGEQYRQRAQQAAARGAQSLNRLLLVAEGKEDTINLQVSDSNAAVVASFLSDIAGNFCFQFVDLRCLEDGLDDDIMNCIDAIRWGRQDLFESVPNGVQRTLAVCRDWADELRRQRRPIKVVPPRENELLD